MIKNIISLIHQILRPYKAELIWILLGLFIQLLSGVLIIKLLTHFLGTDDYGTYSLLNSIIQFIEIVIFSSLIQGASRYSYYLKDISHSFEFVKIISSKIFYIITPITLFLGIIFLFLGKTTFFCYCLLSITLVYLDVNRDIIIGIFHMNRNRKLVTVFKSLDQMLRVISIIIISLLGLVSLVNIYTGFILTAILLFYILWKKKIQFQSQESTDFSFIEDNKKRILKSKVFKFALPFAFASIFTWLLTWADRWVLSSFLTINDVGIYSANSQIANIPFMIISSIALTFLAPILFSKAEKLKKIVDFNSFKSQINKILLFYVLLSFILLITLFFTQNYILNFLLSSDYISNGILFISISLGWLFYQIAQVQVTIFLYTTGDAKSALNSSIISGLIYLVLLIILVNNYGEIGAALSFIIANIFRIILQYFYSKKSWMIFREKIMNVEISMS